MKTYILPVLIISTVLLLSSGSEGGDPPPIPPPSEDVTELDLGDGHGGCRLRDQEEGAEKFLSGYPNLKLLRLCGIKEIPFAVFSLKKLEELDARWNQIEKIPEEIGNLVNLKILLLNDNKITELPESIGQLMNLKEFDLSNNNLTTLPSSIVNLINATINFRFTPLSKKSEFSYLYPTLSPNTQKDINYYNTKIKPYINDFQGLPEAYIVSATSGLSVRNKPKLKAKKIGVMPHKLKIAVYEESAKTETIDGITAPWMRIKAVANGQYMEGWAWGGYLKVYKYEEDYPLQFQSLVYETFRERDEPNFTLDTKRVQFFIKNGVDINMHADGVYKGFTLLSIVANYGNLKDFRFLLANGANFQESFTGRSVVQRKDIGFESKKAFLLTLQDYGYDFKANGRSLLLGAIYFSARCYLSIEEVEEQSSELLDFLKEKLDVEHISEILDEGGFSRRSYGCY